MNIPILAFVALGSNLGPSIDNIRLALGELQLLTKKPLRRSSLWRSTPVDCPPDSPLYVNAVAALEPPAGMTPLSLLAQLRSIEKAFGRRRGKIINEPRLLDLDLITFGGERMDTERLTLPHPRAHLRRFVLQPLSEVAPNLILPGRKKTVLELLRGLRTPETLTRLTD